MRSGCVLVVADQLQKETSSKKGRATPCFGPLKNGAPEQRDVLSGPGSGLIGGVHGGLQHEAAGENKPAGDINKEADDDQVVRFEHGPNRLRQNTPACPRGREAERRRSAPISAPTAGLRRPECVL